MNTNLGRAALAGVVGTAVMTLVATKIAPMMGMPPMNPADMLAGFMADNAMMGWIAHFMIGIVLAGIYGSVAGKLPGPPVARGALFALAPFLVLQVVLMPMMGLGFFSGSASMAMGALVGHLIYGAVVGGIYGAPSAQAAAA
ncbi:MAG: DUF6789 family protein [Gemmatimonadota bacterium]